MSSFHMVTKGIEGDIVQQDDHPFEPSGEIVSLDPIIPGLGMGNDLGIFTEKEQMNKIFGLTKVLARSDDPDDKLQFEAICGTVSDDITYVKEHRKHLRKMKTVFQEKVKMCDSGIAFDSMLEFKAKVFLENMKGISEGHKEAATTFHEALQAKEAEWAAEKAQMLAESQATIEQYKVTAEEVEKRLVREKATSAYWKRRATE